MRNGRRILSINHFSVCVGVCVLCFFPQCSALHTDLDKFKVSVSICFDNVISQSSSSLCFSEFVVCVCVRTCAQMYLYLRICVFMWVEFILYTPALETIIAEIICFQG